MSESLKEQGSRLTITPPTDYGVWKIGVSMRPADVDECHATVGGQVAYQEVLRASIDASEEVYMARWDRLPFALFGVLRDGKVWMMASTMMEEVSVREIVVASKSIISKLLERYDELWNYVLKRNKLHVRWLTAMGFNLEDEISLGPYGDTFISFSLSKQDV